MTIEVVYQDYFIVTVLEINAGWMVEVKGPGINKIVPLLLGESDVTRFKGIIKTIKLSDAPFDTAYMIVAGAAKISMKGPFE
jgi:hypothetical protein